MRTRLLAFAALAAVVLLTPCGSVEACGPDFDPDIFVNTAHPDDPAAFATGHLGILQSGYDSNEYAIAYRILNGGALSAAERAPYMPRTKPVIDERGMTPQQIEDEQNAEKKARTDADPAGQWLLARARYMPATPESPAPVFPTDFIGSIVFDEDYLNCPGPAFANATLTLRARAATWGDKSPALADWIHAQDAVFSNCGSKPGSTPAAAPVGSPALLVADRAYQYAAATFYAKQFDQAARQFAAIAADSSSPWHAWGPYLAARATVRLAFALGKPSEPYSGDLADFDRPTMERARQMLEAILAEPDPKPSRAIVQDELNLILIRTDPGTRAAALSAALAGPAPDPNFSHDLQDLSWLLLHQIKLDSPPPLLAWIAAWRGAQSPAQSFALWQQTHALPWLTVAIAKAGPADAFTPQILDAAAHLAPSSPAYDTVFFHRARLLIALHRTAEARTLLDAAIPPFRAQKPGSTLNALLGLRMATAHSFSEFLADAPRTLLSTGSSGSWNLRELCNDRAHAKNFDAPCPELQQPQLFDQDAVDILNRYTPLASLVEAATTPSLPVNLRQNLALIAWTRAVMLEDAATAAKLAPLLPKRMRDTAGSSVGFPASLAILRNEGVRPTLEAGVSRVASYSVFDDLRDNWWCHAWDTPVYDDHQQPLPPPVAPTFFPPQQAAQAAVELDRLRKMPDAVLLIGQRVLLYAKAHPDDPQVPEALALTVRAGHYACQYYDPNSRDDKSPYTPIGKAAFQLLHSQYPKSPWALKTRYYY